MLFLNSLGMASDMWDYQFVALGDAGLRCIGLDRRGHGRSDTAASGYDFDTFADDIAALVEKLDLEGLTLITHSMGSGEAVRFLSRHGSRRVARVILIAPTTPKVLRDETNPHGVPRAAVEDLRAQWRHDYPKWIEDNLAPFLIPETSRAMMGWVADLLQSSLPVNLACNSALVEADFREEMTRIQVPVLIIHGDRDRSWPIEITGQPSAELLPNSRLLTYKDGPHGLMYTHGEQLNRDVINFIRETSSP